MMRLTTQPASDPAIKVANPRRDLRRDLALHDRGEGANRRNFDAFAGFFECCKKLVYFISNPHPALSGDAPDIASGLQASDLLVKLVLTMGTPDREQILVGFKCHRCVSSEPS
jgi:hypothetical protein